MLWPGAMQRPVFLRSGSTAIGRRNRRLATNARHVGAVSSEALRIAVACMEQSIDKLPFSQSLCSIRISLRVAFNELLTLTHSAVSRLLLLGAFFELEQNQSRNAGCRLSRFACGRAVVGATWDRFADLPKLGCQAPRSPLNVILDNFNPWVRRDLSWLCFSSQSLNI